MATALHEQEHGDSRRLGEILVALGLCRPEEIAAAQHTLEAGAREATMETVRVTVNLLDRMMNLVGELVLARNQLLRFTSASKDRDLRNISQRMNLIAAELKEQVMKARMGQISNISGTIATAVEEQSATTSEMTRNLGDAAKGSEEIANSIEGVATAAHGTSSSAQESQKAADDLGRMASQLESMVSQFKVEDVAAASHRPAAPGRTRRMSAAAGQ